MYQLGVMHATGVGTSRNCELAVGLFKNVAERGSWSKLFSTAYDAYDEDGDVASAALIYMFLGELGYEMAQNNAAFLLDEMVDADDDDTIHALLFGRNGSLARALTNWQRSAGQGSAGQGYTTARLKIGDYYYYGHAVERDYAAAAHEYKLAADASNAQAMFNLGWMHEYGVGLPVDLFLAKRFYDSAAEASADAKLPSTIALAILQAKMWFEAQFGPLESFGEALIGQAGAAEEIARLQQMYCHRAAVHVCCSHAYSVCSSGSRAVVIVWLPPPNTKQSLRSDRRVIASFCWTVLQ
eukprot:m.605447 g.605447  ORF g.605447 m.605447 type:complete len:297 (-) comp22464_c0_seq23:660-1550(-)